MKRFRLLLCFALSLFLLTGCAEIADYIDTGTIRQQVETIASQIDLEAIVTGVVESIDWEELKATLETGYDALTEKYPALKAENVRVFLKDNGLELLNRYIESSDDAMRENARKLGEIIKILNPELAEEVNLVIG